MHYLLQTVRFIPAAISLATATAVFAADYTVVDLGAGVANDINSSGKIVGNGPTGAFVHDGTNRIVLEIDALYFGSPAGPPPFHFTAATANAINDSGRIVGSVVPAGPGSQTAFAYDGSGVGLLFAEGPTADGVNASGDVVGGQGPSFIFHGSTVITPTGEAPKLHAINDSGIAVGSVAPGFGFDKAARFDAGAFTLLNLASLTADVFGAATATRSVGFSINSAGQIVGEIRYAGGSPVFPVQSIGFLYASGAGTQLGGLGGLSSSAHDVNNGGVVVGTATVADGTAHAFIHQNGTTRDLNQLIADSGWILADARAINERGQIVGSGTFNGEARAFLLNPIGSGEPQPPSIVTHPIGGSFALGATVTLTFTATGTEPFTYQWQKDTVNLTGETAASLVLGNVQGTNSGVYRVIVTNAAGSATSNGATVTVLDPRLAVANCALVTVTGAVGGQYRLDYVNQVEATDWKPVATITLTNASQIYVDLESVTNHPRYYRAVRLP